MAIYQIRRIPPVPSGAVPDTSAFRCLYGKKVLPTGQTVLMTTDIHVRVPAGGGEGPAFPAAASAWVGQQVADGGNGLVGTLRSADWPVANYPMADPVVLIDPDAWFSLASVLSGVGPGAVATVGETVFLQYLMDDGSMYTNTVSVGTVTGPLQLRPYLQAANRAMAYEVNFGNLLGENHGARVVDSAGHLIGMLGGDQIGSYCNLIFPAHLL